MKPTVWVSVCGVLVVAAGCRDRVGEQQASAPRPPPAAAIAPVRSSMTLEEKLRRLELELAMVLREEDGSGAEERILRAEAITDQLLEAEPPYAWFAEKYSVEARLRQVQVAADRLVARLRRGADWELLLPGVRRLHRNVERLRRTLSEEQGLAAPPPLDSLLNASPEVAPEEPEAH